MKKTLDQKIASAQMALAQLAKEKRELEKREDAKRLIALGGRIERAGGGWLADFDDAKLKSVIETFKRLSERTPGTAA